jgi:hypothetical protein
MKTCKRNILAPVLFLQFVFSTAYFSQNHSHPTSGLGTSIDLSAPGNGHGAFYTCAAEIYHGDNIISVGPTIQKRSMMMNGFKATYSRYLDCVISDCDDEADMKFVHFTVYTSFQYNNNLPLSFCLVREENMRKDYEVSFNSVKLSTVEMSGGFTIQVDLSHEITWRSYVGAGYYYHLNYDKRLYHEQKSAVFVLGTGLCFYFNQKRADQHLMAQQKRSPLQIYPKI